MPFDRHDLLRQAGYEEGDVLWIAGSSEGNSPSINTTSTTYTGDVNFGVQLVEWDTLVGDRQGVGMMYGDVRVGTDETVDIRLQNTVDGETVAEATGFTSDFPRKVAGPTNYTPTTTGAPVPLEAQVRTNPGNNSAVFSVVYTAIGVRL
jgi:hypothetical protein